MTRMIQPLKAALENLAANPLRTVLSTLGVVIGVASLVAILALGDGLEQYSREQIARTTDLQTIVVTPRTSDRQDGVRVRRERVVDLRQEALPSLRSRLGEDAAATLYVTGSSRASVPGDTVRRGVLVTATLPAAAPLFPEGFRAGEFFGPAALESGTRVVVVPASLAEWYGLEPESLVGRELELDGVAHRIVAVDAREGGDAVQVVVPLNERWRSALEQPDRRVRLAVRASRVEDVEAVRGRVESWLSEEYGSVAPFQVASNRDRVAQTREAMLVFKVVMGAIAGIALLVGGIGIMNILLASVFERTREIGIRKAAGARQRDILLQFLAESVAISGIGSVLGVVLGMVGALAVTAIVRGLIGASVFAAFTWGSVLVAATAAVLVGLLAGTYPARRAARLSPIEAIRHE